MHDHSNGWNEQMRRAEPEAARQWVPGMLFEPHDGETTDVNLFYADLFAGPNPNVPDIGAEWGTEDDTGKEQP